MIYSAGDTAGGAKLACVPGIVSEREHPRVTPTHGAPLQEGRGGSRREGAKYGAF